MIERQVPTALPRLRASLSGLLTAIDAVVEWRDLCPLTSEAAGDQTIPQRLSLIKWGLLSSIR